MSIIGPRPLLVRYLDRYNGEQHHRHDVRPGQVEDYIIQPFVEGREFTIDIFCDFEGNPVCITPRKRAQVRAGEVLKTQICMDRTMIDEAKKLCESFKPCGPCQ